LLGKVTDSSFPNVPEGVRLVAEVDVTSGACDRPSLVEQNGLSRPTMTVMVPVVEVVAVSVSF
jgi:hypothetical protein